VIRFEHRSLPAGLSAVARRGARGDLTIIVSDSLDPSHQRAAVRAALRAARRHDWRLGLLPLPALIFMSATRSVLTKLGHFLRVHTIVTAAAVTATTGVVAAGLLVLAAPTSHPPSGALSPGQPGYQLSPGASQPTSSGRTHGRTRPGEPAPSHVGATEPHVVAVVSPSSGPRPTPSPEPSPSASSSSPSSAPTPGPSSSTPTSQPSATPTPSSSPSGGSGGGGGTCIKLLGVVVCL
jgi:hypothetical protein